MTDLNSGAVLIRIADGTKWQFIHYPSPDLKGGKVTVRADYNNDNFPRRDKSLVHVRRWDKEAKEWDQESHEEFSTADFEEEK